jgi:hypothetical protein
VSSLTRLSERLVHELCSDEDDVSIFEKDIKATPEMHSRALVKSPITLSYMLQYATAPTRVSAACRQINAALTGPKAQLRETVNEPKLKLAWESLEKCWLEFDELRTLRLEGIITQEDMERFVSGWKVISLNISVSTEIQSNPIFLLLQIFIFECRAYRRFLISLLTSNGLYSQTTSSARR